jgi:Tol biopolymer transport system component
VVNPGGLLSNRLTFAVNAAPSPVITTLSPSSAAAGSPGFTLTVNGAGFGPGAIAQFNGTILPTAFVSANQLTAAVPASLVATAGSMPVVVTSGGRASNAVAFTVVPSQPTTGKIAFVRSGDLYLMNADGTGATLLAPSGDAPSWSPDGRWVAFYSRSDQKIYVVKADGSAPPVKLSTANYYEQFPKFSQDGTRIVFQRYLNYPRVRVICLMNIDLSGPSPVARNTMQLTDGSDYGEYPTWLDTNTVLYAAGTSLKTVSANGGSPSVFVSTAPWVASTPTVGPQGTVVFTGTIPGQQAQLYSVSAGKVVKPITSPAQGDNDAQQACIAAGGAKLLFMSGRTGTFQIYQMSADGTGPSINLSGTNTWDTLPAAQPQGSSGRIAFSRNGGLYVMNADGTGVRLLATSGDAPSWSPDGRHITFYSHTDQQIYIVRSDASAPPVKLSTANYYEQLPRFSPDGTRIVYQRYISYPADRRIFMMTVDLSGPTPLVQGTVQLTTGVDYGEFPNWLDNNIVIYSAGSSLKTVPTAGGAPSVFASTAPWVASTIAVASQAAVVFTGTIPGQQAQLYSVSAGKTVKALTDPLQGDYDGRQPCFSAGGSKLVFMSGRTGTFQIFQMNADGTGPRANLSNTATWDTMPACQP